MRNLLGLLLIVILVLFHHAIRAEPHEALFSVPTFGTETDLPPANPRIVLRQRLVTVRSGILDRGGEPTLHLNMFDDIRLEAEWKRTERNGDNALIWFGNVGRTSSSEVVLVWDGSKMAGSITTVGRKYTVRHLRDDLHLLRELDLVSLLASSSAHRAASLALQAVPSGFETDVLDLVNQERAAENLHPLAWDSLLHDAARAHSDDMAQNNYFSHTGLDGRTAPDRIEDAGYPWSETGENIGAGYSTPQAAVNGWMNSAGHRQNILSSTYCDLGVGYASNPSSSYDHYWTQDFGRQTGVAGCAAPANQVPSSDSTQVPSSDPVVSGSSGSSGGGCFMSTIRSW